MRNSKSCRSSAADGQFSKRRPAVLVAGLATAMLVLPFAKAHGDDHGVVSGNDPILDAPELQATTAHPPSAVSVAQQGPTDHNPCRDGRVAKQPEQERPRADWYMEETLHLRDVLRVHHPHEFGGLWREQRTLFIAVVGDQSRVHATVECLHPEPNLVSFAAAVYTERELERGRTQLAEVFDRLADEQGVHTLGVDVTRNQILLRATDPESVDISPYAPEVPTDMLSVEYAPLARPVDAHDRSSPGTRARWIWLLGAFAIPLMIERTLCSSPRARPRAEMNGNSDASGTCQAE